MRHENRVKNQLRLTRGERIVRFNRILEAARDQNRAVDKLVQQRPLR